MERAKRCNRAEQYYHDRVLLEIAARANFKALEIAQSNFLPL